MIEHLYIHVPFCKKKCSYCDFVSYSGKEDLIDGYVDALIKEVKTLTPYPPLPEGEGELKGVRALTTIYIGGGTPTLLSPKHLENIMNILNSPFVIRHSELEISIEANPGTVNKAYLKELRNLGINRLSLGAQTFNDDHLKSLGRIHSSKDIYQAVEDAQAAGFNNLNLDLIFCLPGQTLNQWKEDLNKALALDPNHLSTYNLQYEEGTPLFDLRHLRDEDLDAQMYEYTIDKLTEKGFHHYEISNFARPGSECRHNLTYWKNKDYLGIGCAAHSHVKGKRWANTESIEEYIGYVGATRIDPRWTSDVSSSATEKRETLFMGLRLLNGVPEDDFKGFENALRELLGSGLLKKEGSRIKLTRKGLLLGNLVFERFV